MSLRTIDAHVGGQPLRLVVEGFPAPQGSTMRKKCEWALRHDDHLRRLLMLEPRGHLDMCGAVLTEPVAAGSHAGLLFMDAEGFPPMSGHAIVAVATIALERGLIVPGGDGRAVTFDTPAGTVRAVADLRDQRVARVTFTTPPSFVVRPGLEIALGSRRIRADIAFGGLLYAIVDGESVGVPLDGAHLPELRRAGADIVRAVNATAPISHPHDGELTGVHGTIFTGPSRDGAADLRNVTVSASSAVDRSACGTATAAVMAVIDAMGLLDDTRPFVHESILGTTLRGRVAGRTIVGDVPAILPEIEGTASITGDHTFRLDEDDPIGGGFQLS